MKVLIADDDLTTRKVLELFLKKSGYSVMAVDDGTKAFQILQEPDGPKIALLDWMMPGLDGVEVCRRIRGEALAEQPYFILLTSRDSEEDIVAGLEAGANDYMTKPCKRSELEARVSVGFRVVQLQGILANRVRELEGALAHIKTLQGLLPICSFCHKIRDDQDVWQKLETYMVEHTEADFTHGICPECIEKHYPDIAKDLKEGK